MMLARFKEQLLSPNGMNIVNICFTFMVFLFSPVAVMAAYAIWLAFLIYTIRHTTYRSTQIIYGLLACYALVVILANGYALCTALL